MYNSSVKVLSNPFDIRYLVYWWLKDDVETDFEEFDTAELAEQAVDVYRKKSPDLTYAVVREERQTISLRFPGSSKFPCA